MVLTFYSILQFEIVPGITAALGAAAYGKFPLTAIHAASSVTFASAHKVQHDTESFDLYAQELAAVKGTLVLYMGAKKIAPLFEKLLSYGKSSSTPAMLVVAATTANAHYIVGTLQDLPTKIETLTNSNSSPLPSLIIIGEVVALKDHLYGQK